MGQPLAHYRRAAEVQPAQFCKAPEPGESGVRYPGPGEVQRLQPDQPFQAHDLLGGGRFFWQGPRNYVEIDPKMAPAQIFRIRRRVRTERDFDYFL